MGFNSSTPKNSSFPHLAGFIRAARTWGINDVIGHGCFCEAKSKKVHLRVVHDRGETECEICPNDGREELMSVATLRHVLDCMLHKGDAGTLPPPMDIAAEFEFLIARQREIEMALSAAFWPKAKAVAAQIDKATLRELIKSARKA